MASRCRAPTSTSQSSFVSTTLSRHPKVHMRFILLSVIMLLSFAIAPSCTTAEPSAPCPTAEPAFDGSSACDQPGQQCAYGEECCCGNCYVSYECECGGGNWSCIFTDACLGPNCGEGGAGVTTSSGGSGGSGGV